MGLTAHLFERGLIECANGDGGEGELVVAASREFGRVIGFVVYGLYDGVCEEAAGDLFEGLGIEVFEFVSDAGADGGVSAEEGVNGLLDGLCGGVHDAGEGVDFDDLGGLSVGFFG